jgi:hypothetical protein
MKNFLPHMTYYYSGVEQSKLIAQRTGYPRRAHSVCRPVALPLGVPAEHSLSAEILQRVYFEAAQSLQATEAQSAEPFFNAFPRSWGGPSGPPTIDGNRRA